MGVLPVMLFLGFKNEPGIDLWKYWLAHRRD